MTAPALAFVLGLAAMQAAAASAPNALTPLWRDTPSDITRVRIDSIPLAVEPSALLIRDGEIYTVSDSFPKIYRIAFGPNGEMIRPEFWSPSGMPPATDLEALTALPGGEVLAAHETTGSIFVLNPFPTVVCAAWQTEVAGDCFIGRPNCGIEAMAALPGGRLFVAKERQPRGAFLFDTPKETCTGATLTGRIYLKLPDEVGSDISGATYDEATQHLLIVARSRQQVVELAVPEIPEGSTAPVELALVGTFGYAASEDVLDYIGIDFHQVEGIAVDEKRVLHLIVDNNSRKSRSFGNWRSALLRFFPVE